MMEDTMSSHPVMPVYSRSVQSALKYNVEVGVDGHIELDVPFTPGSRVVVFVIAESLGTLDDLMRAAESTLDFWNNPYDDDDWNDV